MKRRGLSYVEVMVALMILSTGILPLFVLFSGSQRQTVVARNWLQAIYVGRTLIDQARFLPFYRQKPETDETFKPLEGVMLPSFLIGTGIDQKKISWPDFYKRYTYNLKKIPVRDSATKEILAYKLQLTVKWSENSREKLLHFAALAAGMER